MTGDKINEVLDRYETMLGRVVSDYTVEELKHCQQMIPKVRVFIAEGRIEKSFRWLGFIQGVLYCYKLYTIEQMANHNRPAEDV